MISHACCESRGVVSSEYVHYLTTLSIINYKMQVKMENETFTVGRACSLNDMKWIWHASIEEGWIV